MIPFAVLPYHLQRFLRFRLALHILYFHLLCSGAALGQRTYTSFGPVLDLPLEFTPLGLTVGRTKNGIELALTDDRNGFYIYKVSPFPTLHQQMVFTSSAPLQGTIHADIDGDGNDEYFSLSLDGESVHVLSKSGSSKIEETIIPILTNASHVVVADINNDKRKDILLFGRKLSGVQVLLGKGSKRFLPGDVLFPDISVSDLKAADLNGDAITDLVILNWLSNELLTFYGIGRGVFSEQVAVKLPGEPGVLSLTSVSKQRTFSVAVTLPERGTIAVLEGNPTGEILPVATIASTGNVQTVQFAHANDDALYDIVFGTAEQIGVALSVGHGRFSDPVWLGPTGAHWALADIDGNKRQDLILVERKRKSLIVIGNTGGTTTKPWPMVLSTGRSPGGLSVKDFNGDGTPDVAVVNTGSSSMSLFLNQGKGMFSGQYSMTLPEQPVYIHAAGFAEGSPQTLITSHTSDEKLTVIKFKQNPSGHESFTIPAGVNPYVVLAREDSGSLEILVRYSAMPARTPSLSLFEQISGRQFVERSLRANLPNWIVALTVDDLTGNGKYDLVCATHSEASRTTIVSVGSTKREFDFTTIQKTFEYSDSTGSTRGIATGFVDSDSAKDIVVFIGEGKGAIIIAYGEGDGTFRDSLEWIRDVTPLHEDALLITDVDMDGYNDIVFIDQKRSSVLALYQRTGGGFQAPIKVISAVGVRAIRVGQFVKQGQQDLVVSHGDRGMVSIIPHAFRR
ncbi:MAG: FG-GAP repeat domain-containing protein [Bacteroidota bacterium]